METEKPEDAHAERVTPISDIDIDNMDPDEYAAKEKRLVQKVDIRLMPCLILMIILKSVVLCSILSISFQSRACLFLSCY